MSTRLVILGLLRERPLYGYELKQIIEDHMGDWTDIAFGSIYYALGKLEKEQRIRKVGTEQEGNRPSRTVYEITDAGREAFKSLLRETWQAVERPTYAIDLALFFIHALPSPEVSEYLETRLTHLRAALAHIDEHRRRQLDNPEVPAVARAIFDHSRAHLEAEAAWTQAILDDVRSGKYD